MTLFRIGFYEHPHDHFAFFTNKGRVYRLKGYEIPEYGRRQRLPIVNPPKIDEGESIQTIITVEQDRSDESYLFLRFIAA